MPDKEVVAFVTPADKPINRRHMITHIVFNGVYRADIGFGGVTIKRMPSKEVRTHVPSVTACMISGDSQDLANLIPAGQAFHKTCFLPLGLQH